MEKCTDGCGLAVSAGRSARARFVPELVPCRNQPTFGCPFKTHRSLICVINYFANVFIIIIIIINGSMICSSFLRGAGEK